MVGLPLVDRCPRMDRRTFIGVLACELVAVTGAIGEQRAGKLYRIGYLSAGANPPAVPLAVFTDALRDLGWIEGKTFVLEPRFADNRPDRLAELAAELVRLNVDVIVTRGTLAPLAAKRATSTIPIVMTSTGDPIGSGIVSNLARPGGNITGMSMNSPELAGKRLQLLKDMFPGIATVAVLWNEAIPYPALVLAQTEAAGRTLGIRILALPVHDAGSVQKALDAALRGGAGGLITVEDQFTNNHRAQIIDFAARHRLPAMYGLREFVDAGGLLSYGTHLADLSRRGAQYVDKILKGAKPGDLPIEQPTKFELVINLKTASALGLTIPQSLLLRADEVIQ
jgi:putative tryptophan/tyrosine transport system substrate-binding protein